MTDRRKRTFALLPVFAADLSGCYAVLLSSSANPGAATQRLVGSAQRASFATCIWAGALEVPTVCVRISSLNAAYCSIDSAEPLNSFLWPVLAVIAMPGKMDRTA